MKVAVSLTIEMTDEQIAELMHEYNVDRSEVRQFVRDEILNSAQCGGAVAEFWTASLR